MLGRDQIDWLVNALSFSQAPFKFIIIGGQVLSTGAVYENYSTYPEERKYLLNKIREAKIEGVVFLDGDMHQKIKALDAVAILKKGLPEVLKFTTNLQMPNEGVSSVNVISTSFDSV